MDPGCFADTRVMAKFVLLGACQQQQSLEAMQPLYAAKETIAARLASARADGSIAGALLLATCNRFEVILDISELADAVEDMRVDALRERIFAGVDVPLSEKRGRDVVLHLVRVSAGLESLVLGEDQILGQVGQAFRDSESAGTLGKALHMLWSRVMRTARKLRAKRPHVSAPRSVAEFGARIAREAGPRTLIIGAGTTARTAAESLAALGAREISFANRTRAHAERLAKHFGGRAMTIDELLLSPPDVDSVMVAIAGRTLQLPAHAMPSLQLVVDISQPRVVTGLEAFPNVRVLDLDALAAREQARESLLETWSINAACAANDETDRVMSEFEHGQANLGQLLGLHVENASAEVDRALRGRLRNLDPALAEEVRRLAERVARRNAHLHIHDLKHYARN